MSAAFSVLVVCRANQCRSPLVEHLLTLAAAERGLDWEVSSAGTQARPGAGIHPSAARILTARGIDTSSWRSRAITQDLVRRADLILTASARHQSVVNLDPSALRRTYTLLQFAHLAAGVAPEATVETSGYGPWLVQQVRDRRANSQPLSPGARDLADPIGQPFSHFRRCATVIDRALEQIFRSRPSRTWSWPLAGDP